MPGASLSSTARVASGVTSRGVRPVPPVVRMRSARSASAQAARAAAIADGLVGDEGAVGEDEVVLRGPGGDGVARGIGPLAAVAGVGDGEDGEAHGQTEGRKDGRTTEHGRVDRQAQRTLPVPSVACSVLRRASRLLPHAPLRPERQLHHLRRQPLAAALDLELRSRLRGRGRADRSSRSRTPSDGLSVPLRTMSTSRPS